MAERMRAAVYHGPRDLSVETVPVPRVGPSDVLIGVRDCGICGSDVHSYKAGMYVEPGQIMGHEFMGVVAVVGENVEGVRVLRGSGLVREPEGAQGGRRRR